MSDHFHAVIMYWPRIEVSYGGLANVNLTAAKMRHQYKAYLEALLEVGCSSNSSAGGVLAHPIDVLVVDDHGIVREGLICVLEQLAHVTVVGSAASGKEAVVSAKRLKPDLILMDLVLPELSGLDAIERILAALPNTRIIVLSMCQTAEHIARALRAGALGYVVKRSASKELHRAVLAVMRGELYLSAHIADAVLAIATRSAQLDPLERLSAREREVLHLTVAGMTSGDIALKLNLSRKTVDTYRSRIMEKLGLADHASLIRFALAHALVPA